MDKIDLTDYKKKVADGLWELIKNDKGICIKAKQFDVDTGVEIAPVYFYLKVDEIKELKNVSVKASKSLTELMTDINAL